MKPYSLAGMLSFSLSVIGLTILASASPAKAGSLTLDQTTLKLFNGSTPVNFNITLDDLAAGEGKVQFKVDVADGFFADLRGIFFHVKDESLLTDLSVTGAPYVTQVIKSANSVLDLGNGGNVNGGGSNVNGGANKSATDNKNDRKSVSSQPANTQPINTNGLASGFSSGSGGFDVGVEIGTQGTGKDDFRSATFVVSHANKKLSLSDFSEQGFGIRMMSVGTSANNREGSSKLTGAAPVLPPVVIVPPDEKPEEKPVEIPEPSTAFLALASVGTFKVLKKRTMQG